MKKFLEVHGYNKENMLIKKPLTSDELKQNIDALTSLQKDMRVSYVIIKKLDITEDYLKLYGLKEELK